MIRLCSLENGPGLCCKVLAGRLQTLFAESACLLLYFLVLAVTGDGKGFNDQVSECFVGLNSLSQSAGSGKYAGLRSLKPHPHQKQQ